MKQLLSLLCFIAIVLTSEAQDQNFDLSKYKFPDYKRHEMKLNFNSSGYNWDTSYETSGWSAGNSSSNLGLNYDYQNLTRERIDNLFASINGFYDYSIQDNRLQNEKQFKPEASLGFRVSRDYYLTEDRFFLEGFSNLGLSLKGYKKTIDSKVDLNSNSTSFNLGMGLGAGFGRLENVSDLVQAHYILESLKKQNSLHMDLTEKNIYEFATLSSRLKNKRFFDSRLRKIAELQALDSLLHKQGLIKEPDISYFTTLNDYWNFTGFPNRVSGSVLKLLVSPELWNSRGKSLNTSLVKSSKTYLNSNLSFEYNKQLNLFWERIFNVEVSNSTLIDQSGKDLNNYPDNFPKNLLRSSLDIGYGFYPNTRTAVHTSIGYIGKEEPTYQDIGIQSKFWKNEIYFGFNGGYYISPQLQVYGNLNLSYGFEEYSNGDHKRLNYNLGLRYAIF